MDDYLLQILKPARYIGEEWNISHKDFNAAEVKFALCFPDLYEVGMSNLGIRILYGILNQMPQVVCERFFSPAIDMEGLLRSGKLQLFSLESKKTLREFDLVGFSLGYELSYTNVLNLLDLGGIPLKSALRDASFPLVIAGGPCVLNPEPMHEFIDIFVIGEAEEALQEIVGLYKIHAADFKAGKISKEEFLLKFCGIEGVYAPSLYTVSFDQEGKQKEFKPKYANLKAVVKKRSVKDLNQSYFPLDWLVPFIQVVHDRLILEIMRGCPNQCRFCQARTLYSPFRIRKTEAVSDLACKLYQNTGYEEISLVGLSASDHPQIKEILGNLISLFEGKKVSVSLPSIKPREMVGELASLISKIKKTGLTFAPEAASEKLRKVLNKDFDIPEFLRVLEQAYQAGYQHLKLYFMIGLPKEEKDDLGSILDFANNASQLRKKTSGFNAQVNISVNALIPKPHTAFQWFGMEGIEQIKEKQGYLRKLNRNKKIKLSFHNAETSFLEGVIARGDRRLSQVIESAFRKGARFDGWQEHFNFARWMEAFQEAGIAPEDFLKEKSKNELLAWDFIDSGVSKEALLNDYNKSIA
ncbi:MAG: TIGR03960 family B12-binding radical SAM protein [Candidatus Omnitrophica bacterium]|nr:TIGR03960 family B12-binding radical SAM protein [Candidatus Omnitrophota bacterium]